MKKKEKPEFVPHLAKELEGLGATFKVIRNMCGGHGHDFRCVIASIEGIELVAGEAIDRINQDLKNIHTLYPILKYKPIEA